MCLIYGETAKKSLEKKKSVCYNEFTMAAVKVFSHAKLNLSLNIRGKKDGYHLLDSFVASVDISDEIIVRPRKDDLINVTMHGLGSEGIHPEENTALRAGEKFVGKYDVRGADITVYKNIPMGAGMGGSSADAAGVLRGMAQLYGIRDEAGIKDIADSLGSDTGYMLSGGFARMTGRGEQVWPLNRSDRLWFLVVAPRTPVATGSCYSLYDDEPDEMRDDTEKCIRAFLSGDYEAMSRYFYNALYAPACRLNADVEAVAREVEGLSPMGWAMTGSGSAVFAMYKTKELCEWAASRYRGRGRAMVTCTLDPAAAEQKKKIKWRNPFVLSKEETENANE